MPAYLETAVEIARESGALLAKLFDRHIPFELKGDFDLVTEADRASERLVIERLKTHFPSHAIVAEEGGGHESTSGFRWYVDPLDGTTNFAHGFPCFNVTLALEQAGELIAGVVYDPIRDEMFTAERGAGAYLNNRRIKVSGARRLEESLVATGFPAASVTSTSTSTSTISSPWPPTACAAAARRPSIWPTWRAGVWTLFGNSVSTPGTWRPGGCW